MKICARTGIPRSGTIILSTRPSQQTLEEIASATLMAPANEPTERDRKIVNQKKRKPKGRKPRIPEKETPTLSSMKLPEAARNLQELHAGGHVNIMPFLVRLVQLLQDCLQSK